MKKKLVSITRKALPSGAVRALEEGYRRGRVHLVSARYGYPAKGLRVVAVTGTNGKTTTANYLNEIFKAAGQKTALFTTAVIEIAGERRLNDLNATVALTSEMQAFFKQAKDAKVDVVVLEITSHALQQHKLATVPIECAVMTNLTQDHLDYHGTMQNYAEAKGRLFANNPRYIVLNRDDEWFDFFDKYQAGEHKITYGENDAADAHITHYRLYKKGSEAKVVFDHQTEIEMGSHLPGKYNVSNYVAAACAAYALGTPIEAIVDGIANLEGIPGRYERVNIEAPYEVIVDYAHTPDALTKLFEAARAVTKGRLILVFGAAGDRDKSKRPIMGEIAAKCVDRIFVTDEESYSEDPTTIRQAVLKGIHEAGGEAKTKEIADRREAIAEALSIARKDDTVLITGMGHEVFRIVNGEKLPWNDADVVKELLIK